MDKKPYAISLSDEDKKLLQTIIEEGKEPERTIRRAKALLMCDAKRSDLSVKNSDIAESLGISRTAIQDMRADYKQGGLEFALYDKRSRLKKEKAEKRNAILIEKVRELIMENPPEGKKRWSVRLLCSECERRGYAEHVAVGKMCELLKENNIAP